MIQYVHMPLKIMEVTTHQLPEIGRLIYLETSNVSVTLVLLFYFLAIYKHIHQISKLCITQGSPGEGLCTGTPSFCYTVWNIHCGTPNTEKLEVLNKHILGFLRGWLLLLGPAT